MRNWRLNFVLTIILLFGVAIIGRLAYLQIIQRGYYGAMAKGQQKLFQSQQGLRGNIFFEDGRILATNNTIEEGSSRKYLQGSIASQVVGFFGGELTGQYGVEGFYDNILQGKTGFLESGAGDNGGVAEVENGSDIYLTLDYNIQFTAEKLLEKAKNDLDIESGQIIVMDPVSGKIVAMANFPNFDPNNYSEVKDFQVFQNATIQKLFEPGSVMKPITMAAAINEGKISPDTTYVDKGKLKIGGNTISNYGDRVWGEQTMTGVLEKSINTGAVFAENKLGNDLFMKYLNDFELFQPTDIGLQGEVFSDNKELKKGYEINYDTAAFGQGIDITPVQLLRAFSVIANGGKMVNPYIVEKIAGRESEKIPGVGQTAFAKEIISQKTASQVSAMLVSVIENGYSKVAKIPGYYLAGKTGTAQIPWSAINVSKKGYSNETWQSFIGFGPAFNPKFMIFVKLDNPKAKTAEYSAAPIFKDLAKYIIDYWQIPPDYE
jgi:cell division protein FtsI/penicillin-binding protein 2